MRKGAVGPNAPASCLSSEAAPSAICRVWRPTWSSFRAVGPHPTESVTQALGRIAADIWCLRQMSLSVAGQLARGKDPYVEAAIVKDLGNTFEQNLPTIIQALTEPEFGLESTEALAATLSRLLQCAPSFSLRGGTREILRGIIARGLGLR